MDGIVLMRMKDHAIAFQSLDWFNGHHGWNSRKSVSGNWNDITTKHFAGSEELEVDLLLDIDNEKLNACVVGKCVKGKEVKIWEFIVSSMGFVPYFNLLRVGQQLQCIKIPISWYGLPQKDLFATDGN